MASVPGVVLSGIVGSVLMLGSGMLVSGTGMVISVVGIIVSVVGSVVASVVPMGSIASLLQAQAQREKTNASAKIKMIIFFICILLFKISTVVFPKQSYLDMKFA